MAFDATPTTWLPNYGFDGVDTISLKFADFAELDSTECDAVTGDIRKIYFGLADGIFDSWNDTEAANRPEQMTISKSVYTDTNTNTTTNTYTLRFVTEITGQEVAPEPAP